MTPVRKVTTFRVDPDVGQAMKALRERDGIPLSEQIRRALRAWLEAKGALRRAKRRRRRPSTTAALRGRR
jgi:Ribbon-helix-helix domain